MLAKHTMDTAVTLPSNNSSAAPAPVVDMTAMKRSRRWPVRARAPRRRRTRRDECRAGLSCATRDVRAATRGLMLAPRSKAAAGSCGGPLRTPRWCSRQAAARPGRDGAPRGCGRCRRGRYAQLGAGAGGAAVAQRHILPGIPECSDEPPQQPAPVPTIPDRVRQDGEPVLRARGRSASEMYNFCRLRLILPGTIGTIPWPHQTWAAQLRASLQCPDPSWAAHMLQGSRQRR
jgi:hypothetical protein